MAYVPISNKAKTGKYVPIGKKVVAPVATKKTPLPPSAPEVPFDATTAGITLNTIKGIPGATLDVLREIPRGIAGTAGQATGALFGMKQEDISLDPNTMGPLGSVVLGKKKIEPAKEGADLLQLIPGVSEETARKYGPALYAGMTLSDFVSLPGKKKAVIETIKTVDNLTGARRLLKDAGVADETIDTLKLDSKAVAAKTDAEAEAIIKEATEAATKKTAIPTASVKMADGVLAAPVKQGVSPASGTVVKSVDEVIPVINGRVSVQELSQLSPNSLQNNTSGIRPKSVEAQLPLVAKGASTRPVEIRVVEDGTIDIVDGRHLLEASLRSGVKDIPIKDVTADYFPEGVTVIRQPSSNVESAAPATLTPLPKLPPTQSPDEVIAGALERYRGAAPKPLQTLPVVAKAAKEPTPRGGIIQMTGKLLTPISSRLGRINPKLKSVLRKFEFDVAQSTHENNARILPALTAMKKLPKEDALVLDLAMKNGDEAVISAIAKKHGIERELREVRFVLEELYDRAKAVGIDIPYRENYFPRIVKNPEKYIAYLRSQSDWSEIQALVERHAADRGKKYTDLTTEEITGIVNNYLRGFGNKIQLSTPNFAKKRSIDVIDDSLNDFYEPSDNALSTYIIRMNDEIEGRKFFGKALKTDEKVLNTEDSIGAYVMGLIQKGELDPRFEKEVADILRARFARGKMNGAFDVFRNMEYLSTMGSPISAITQIGDVAWSIYDNGLLNTAKGMFKRSGRITKEDLGIEQITQEFSNQTKTGKALDWVFKHTGMSALDRLGKETLVNAEMAKFKNLAKRKDAKFQRMLADTFDLNEVPQVMDEFAAGELTPNTKLVLFNKLLDFQPVAKSEMPQAYLENPNGRIFYMLKSFTLKQYDIFRREAFDKIATGEKKQVAEGIKNLVMLAGAFTLANATADEIKDLILGRETPPSDRVVDNLWRLVGASKYDVYKARTDGVGQTILKKILFPTSIADRAYQDVNNFLTGKEYEKGPLKGQKYKLESTQSIPIGGKLYYWWMGRGAQKEQYKAGGTTSQDTTNNGALPGLPKLPKLPSSEGAGLPKLPKI